MMSLLGKVILFVCIIGWGLMFIFLAAAWLADFLEQRRKRRQQQYWDHFEEEYREHTYDDFADDDDPSQQE